MEKALTICGVVPLIVTIRSGHDASEMFIRAPLCTPDAQTLYLSSFNTMVEKNNETIDKHWRKLDSMRWFSHRRTGPRPRGPLPKKNMPHEDRVPDNDSRRKCRTFRFFIPGDLDLWPLTLTLEIGRDFCTLHLTAKFHVSSYILNRSEVIVLTNKQTNWQTNRRRWKHPPRSTMLRRWVKIN